jgi:osmoprotectant transport system permease protein
VTILQLFWHWLLQPGQWHGGDGIPARLLEHLSYSGLSLAFAAAIALPLGLLTGHTGRGGLVVINSANAARALPTVGLLTLVVITIGIGLAPVLVALVALAIPPILVNTYEGVRNVDADVRDAASGMGMTGWQVLTRVEVPVALPLILLGLRIAAIQVVSTATIAAFVSLGGLGRFIFDGLASRDYEMVVGGAVLVALLAVVTELAFLLAARTVVSKGVRAR